MIAGVITVVLAYFLGSISSSILIGHMFGVDDIRKHGSGNAGSTNVLRIIGKKAAAMTFICDFLKGVVPVAVVKLFVKDSTLTFMLLSSFAVVIGHIFPIYFGFKGGKGVATSFGAVIAISVATGIFWIPFALFGVWLVVVFLTRYVSLGSVIVFAAYPVLVAVLFKGLEMADYIQYVVFAVAIGLLGIIMHRKNIGRLISGTESKIGQKAK